MFSYSKKNKTTCSKCDQWFLCYSSHHHHSLLVKLLILEKCIPISRSRKRLYQIRVILRNASPLPCSLAFLLCISFATKILTGYCYADFLRNLEGFTVLMFLFFFPCFFWSLPFSGGVTFSYFHHFLLVTLLFSWNGLIFWTF